MLSKWDEELDRQAHPWYMPRGLFFWWVWRPLLFGGTLVVMGSVTWFFLRATDRLMGAVWCMRVGAPVSELTPCVE